MSNGWHTGGDFSSLPKRTTLHGQDHMLSYITPEEAAMLRQQGGGVTPTGGQYRGPGGVPAFTPGPPGSDGGGNAPAGGHGTGGGPPGGHAGGAAGIVYQANKGISLMNQILPEYGSGADALRKYHQSRGHSLGNPADPGFAGKLMAERARIDRQAPAPAAPAERSGPSKEELEKERQELLDASIQRGAERMSAMYANLGWGAPPPQYGELSTGEQLFPATPGTPQQVSPAYAGLLGIPAVAQAVGQGGAPAAPQPSLEEQVRVQAEEIRTAAKGGLIRKYDLGGLVDNMLLQASRTQKNIPSNAVS